MADAGWHLPLVDWQHSAAYTNGRSDLLLGQIREQVGKIEEQEVKLQPECQHSGLERL